MTTKNKYGWMWPFKKGSDKFNLYANYDMVTGCALEAGMRGNSIRFYGIQIFGVMVGFMVNRPDDNHKNNPGFVNLRQSKFNPGIPG